MSLEETLKMADEIVFEKTGQHLDDLQKAVLEGTIKRKRYRQIAEDFNYSESCIRGIGAELWQILSDELGEIVTKSNLQCMFLIINFLKLFSSKNMFLFFHSKQTFKHVCYSS